jgi:hypothetical protein
MSTLKFNKEVYLKSKENYGLQDDVEKDGEILTFIPRSPDGIMYWLADKCATPLFNESGDLIGWKHADDKTKRQLLAMAQNALKEIGYSIKGLEKIIE